MNFSSAFIKDPPTVAPILKEVIKEAPFLNIWRTYLCRYLQVRLISVHFWINILHRGDLTLLSENKHVTLEGKH